MNGTTKSAQTENDVLALIREHWEAAEKTFDAERANDGAAANSIGPAALRAKDNLELIDAYVAEGIPFYAIPHVVHLLNCAKDHKALQLVAGRIDTCVDALRGIEEERPGFFDLFQRALVPLINGGSEIHAPSNGPQYVLGETARRFHFLTPEKPEPRGNDGKVVGFTAFVPQ